MKIIFSAPIELSHCEDESVLTDLPTLKGLSGLSCLEEAGEIVDKEYVDSGSFDGVDLKDTGICLVFDEDSACMRYQTTVIADKELNAQQIALLQETVVNSWQEGSGMEMSQIVLSDGQGLYISSGDDQVGDVGLSCVVESA